LEDTPRRRFSIPWADITLFAVIGGLVVIWWLRPTTSGVRPRIILANTPPVEVQATGASRVSQSATRQQAALPAAQLGTGKAITISSALTTTQPSSAPKASGTPAAPPAVAPTAAATPTPYKVQTGDSVGLIADRFGTTVKAIVDANNLSADLLIFPGQALIIPAASGTGGPATSAPTPTPTGGTLIYRVSQGDTVASIAARYSSSIDWILAANNMKATDFLSIGQALTIPLSNNTPEPTPTATPGPATATPTVGPRFRVPMPVGPVDGGIIASGGDLLLTWTSVGVLSDDEWYVVTLTPADGSTAPVPPYWTKSTSWRLQHNNLNGGADTVQGASASEGVGAASASAAAVTIATPAPVQYTWQVQVVSGTPGNPGPVLSPPSAPRKFTWQ
jgi:LysM repeat protein